MLGTLKLASKLRNRQRGGERNSHSDPVTMVQCLDMPRPPGRRRLEQPRPPERDSESGDPARPRIRDWFRGSDTRKRHKDTTRYRHDGGQRRNEEMYYSKERNQAERLIDEEDNIRVNEGFHLGRRQRRRDKVSHRNEDFQERRYDTDIHQRHDRERRKDKVRYKDEDIPLSDNEEYHVRHVEDSFRAREVVYKKNHRFKEKRPKDALEEIRRHPGEKRPRQIELKSQKLKDTRPKRLAKSDVNKRLQKEDSKPIKSKKQLANAKSKRKPSITIQKSGMPNAKKTKRSRLCDIQKELSSQKASSIKRKGWVEDLRVYKEPINKRLTVFEGIMGKNRQSKVAKSNEVTKPQNCRVRFHRDVRKPGDWQAQSTRFEVNARLGNIERSLKDLAVSTKNVVYTRLRVIENSLKDITGFREKQGVRINKAKTKTLGRSRNRVAPKQKEQQTIQWLYESKAYQKDIRNTKKEKPKSLEREKKVERKKKKTSYRELKFRNEEETPPVLEKKRVEKQRISEETRRDPEPDPSLESPLEILDEERETETAPPEKITCDVHVPSGQGDRRDLKDMHFSIFDDTVIDVDGAPKQTSIADTTIEGDLCPPDLRGIVVLDIDGIIAIIVTDWANRSIKCFYSIENQNCYSQLKLAAGPWGIKKLRNNLIGVTIPKAQQIMLLRVSPDLIHESTIETSKSYWGLAVMTSSTLIGGSSQPSCLDEIDVEGNILQSFSNITSPDGTIENPDCIHITKTGDILLSDSGRKSVMCVTSSGDVKFTFSPRIGQELLYPSGVVSISSGDILLADSAANKVIHLNEAGKYERDVLASRSDVEKPFGLCVSGTNIYVATRCREVQVYSFS